MTVAEQIAFLGRFFTPRTVFMEIGAGDCALSRAAAGYVERVHAVDVAEGIVRSARWPSNLKLARSDGVSVPVLEGSVDVALSHQRMEHLHAGEARAQLEDIHRSLAPGGVYVRAYTARESRRLLRAAGFRKLRFYAGVRGVFVRIPSWLADSPLLRARLALRVAAVK